MEKTTCLLPGGYVDEDGRVHRDVELVPLSGREEEFLADKKMTTSAALVTAILSRCIHHIGAISPVSKQVSRDLLVADRQYLLLKLREITFGGEVQATIFCPWPDCGNKVDIDFSLEDVPVRKSKENGPTYKMELSPEASIVENGNKWSDIIFRLPNGGDQEAISPFFFENEANALTMLLERCILGIESWRDPLDEVIRNLSPKARMEIEREMEEVSPKVDLMMAANCPDCNREFELPFDLQEFFFGELRNSRDLLYREVHYLAYHYHWSEREIMEMPKEKRHGYIDVLADEIERLNNAI